MHAQGGKQRITLDIILDIKQRDALTFIIFPFF